MALDSATNQSQTETCDDQPAEAKPSASATNGQSSKLDWAVISAAGGKPGALVARFLAQASKDPRKAAALALPLFLLLVAYFHSGTFARLWRVWDIDPNYSHGMVVPLFALGLAWVAWKRHSVEPVQAKLTAGNLLMGGGLVLAGFTMHTMAVFLNHLMLDVVALITILVGLVTALGGLSATWVYLFPIGFLIFMAPLPAAWQQPVALNMQHFVSVISTEMLSFFGVPVFREGYRILIPGFPMEVGEACSGLRGLTAIVALAAAIGYLSGRSFLYRISLLLLAIPIAIAANCVRVFGTGIIMLLFGKKWAEGVFHTLEGLVVVALAAVLVVAVAWALAQFENYLQTKNEPPAGSETPAPAG